jgi:tRNA(Arg) A34 adenosine deaminase TadA
MSNDIVYLKKAFTVAETSYKNGNLPFGCILVNTEGIIIEEGENLVITSNNNIAHCEIVLINKLAGKYERDYLGKCTIYATTEPCPMCSAAIFWSGIGKLVYALSKEGYHHVANTSNPDYLFDMSSKELLAHGGRKVEVAGPIMEEEAKIIYKQWVK